MTALYQLPAYDWKLRFYQEGAWLAMGGAGPAKKKKEVCLAWHRRAGKDEIGMHAAIINAFNRVGNYWHMLPKAEQCRRAIWEAINPRTGRVRWKDSFPAELIARVDNQAMLVQFKSGSSWQLLGSDNYDNIVGAPPVWIFYSEAALANPAAFGFFRPILKENKGSACYVSSVRGRNHFHNIFTSLVGKDYAYTSHLSATETDVFTPEELEEERRAYIALYGKSHGESLFRQEYYSDWDASSVGAVWGAEIEKLKREGRANICNYDPRYPVLTSWDLGTNDPTVILFWQEVGTDIRMIDWAMDTAVGIEHYAEILKKKPYFYIGHIAPHDIKNMEWGSGETRIMHAKKFGIEFTPIPRVKVKAEDIGYGASLLNRCIINVHERRDEITSDCKYILDALTMYHYKFHEERKILSTEPEHDWTSHFADAFMTMGHYQAMKRSSTNLVPQRLQGAYNGVPLDPTFGKWTIDPKPSYGARSALGF